MKKQESHDRFTPLTSSLVAKLSLDSHFSNSKTPGKQENYSDKTICAHQIGQTNLYNKILMYALSSFKRQTKFLLQLNNLWVQLFRSSSPRKENSDSAVSRALEEALRTSTILGWDFIEQSTSPIMTSTTSVANNNTIDLMSSVRFASLNKSISSRSTPTTAHSSPKASGIRGKTIYLLI